MTCPVGETAMSVVFTLLERQIDKANALPAGGKLVLSRLTPGESLIAAPAPSVKLVMEGEEYYRIDGRTVRVGPGQFLYLDKGAPCLAYNRDYAVGLCLFVPPGPDSPGDELVHGHDPVLGRSIVLSTGTSPFGKVLERMGARIARNPDCGAALAADLIRTAASALEQPLSESRAAVEGLGAAKLSTRRELYQRLETARAYLHAHPDRSITLPELARAAALSQFHLARYFRAAFGAPPIAYHRSLRLERAAERIQTQGWTVARAAEAAGYSEPSALCHALRRRRAGTC